MLILLAALTIAGLQFPATLQVGAQRLTPASCGVRDTLWIEHYVAVLYLRGGAPPAAVLDRDAPKAVRLQIADPRFLPDDIPELWRPALERHLDAEALARVRAAYRGLGDGDGVTIAYEPARGVSMHVNDRLVATAPGHALIDALLQAWAEDEPARGKLGQLVRTHQCPGASGP